MADIGEGEHPRRVEILPVTTRATRRAHPNNRTDTRTGPGPGPGPGRDTSRPQSPRQLVLYPAAARFGGAGLAGGSVILLSVNFFHPSPTGSTGHGEHREQAG